MDVIGRIESGTEIESNAGAVAEGCASERPGSEHDEITGWKCTIRIRVNNGRAPEGQALKGAAFLLTCML